MRLFARLLAPLVILLALGATAFAQELTADQRASLEARIASFDAAMKASDMAVIMGVVPPKVLDKIASTNGITTEQLIAATQEQFAQAMQNVTIESFSMDLDSATIVALADGTPYALIPTETLVDMGQAGGRVRTKSSTLGLLDGETWYLVRVEDPQQVAILKEVYPGFADVEFPAGSMEPVTE